MTQLEPLQQVDPESAPRLTAPPEDAPSTPSDYFSVRRAQIRRFISARASADPAISPAAARLAAEAQHASLLNQQLNRPLAHVQGTSSLSSAWTPLGPSALASPRFGAITGRITSIVIDPDDSSGNTVYIGTTGGGVWKSTNAAGSAAAVSFTPLTDRLPAFNANAGYVNLPSLSIGSMAIQPAPNPVLLAGTGDPNDAIDSYYGEGFLRSTDGGLTWAVVNASFDGVSGNHDFSGLSTAALAWSTSSPSLVVAAMSTSLEGLVVGANRGYAIPGLYYSPDAGLTWHMASVYDGSVVVQQPNPTNTGGVPASSVVWNARRGKFYAALRGHGYYSSADGATWSRLPQQPGTGMSTANCQPLIYSPQCPVFRGTLAVQPATGDLYALTIDLNNRDQGLWQDLCNAGPSGACSNPAPVWGARLDGGAFEITSGTGAGAGSGSTSIAQGDYNLSLAALPSATGGTLLFAGTVDLFRCALAQGANSCTFRNTTNVQNGCNAPAAVAPSQHAIAGFVPVVGDPVVLLGNDGGLWRSPDGVAQTGPVCSVSDRNHFENLNPAIAAGGSLAEVVGFAQNPNDPNVLLAGFGALGSGATSAAATLVPWPQLADGEGGFPLLDPNSPLDWTLTIGAGVNLKRCTSGSSCTAADFASPATLGAPQVSRDVALLDAPVLLDPALSSSVLLGTCRVWRGPAGDGSAWSSANALGQPIGNGGSPCTASSPLIRSLAAGGPPATSGHLGSTVIYAGLAGTLDGGGRNGGHVFVMRSANTASGTTPWIDISNRVSNGSITTFNPYGFDISSLTVDTHDPTGGTVYVTIMGFGGAPHLYQSMDFGAHWLNITGNLPTAPANAVLIDPNDANTLYVATDTGVYVTQAVTTCSTTNCWGVLGTGLPNTPALTLAVGVDLPTPDGRSGMLRVGTYGRGIWQTPLLTAQNRLQPALSLSATDFTFASQQVATQSDVQTLTITSSGSIPVTFGTLDVAGDFVETDTCTGQTVAVGSSCTVQLRFAPTLTGARSGSLTVHANIPTGQASVTLSGSGTAPASIVLAPLVLSFAPVTVNSTTAAQIITLSNIGGNPATLNPPVITGDFAITINTCGATLPVQTGCSVAITFRPTASGKRSGTFTVTDSAGTQVAQLTGTGNSPATDTLAPTSLSFSQQVLGSASTPQNITLTNTGDVPLTLIAAAVVSGDFTVTNNCGNSLAAHSSCAMGISFVPTTTGAQSGTLQVTDQFRTQTVTLSGAAVAPAGVSLSPASLSFAATGAGLSAPAQALTLTNNGGLPLHLRQTSLSGPDFTVAATTCGDTLNPAAACTFSIVFKPSAAGPLASALTLTDDAGSGTQTASLAGTGVDFSLVAGGATSVTAASGSTATFPLRVNSLAGLNGTVALTCSGAPAHSSCNVSPASAVLGQEVAVSVTVQTGLTTAVLRDPDDQKTGGTRLAFAFALGLPFWLALTWKRSGLRGRHNPLRSLLNVALLGVLVCGLAGCGAARVVPLTSTAGTTGSPTTPPAPLTPTGVYSLTVTGSSYGVVHTVNLSLQLQ